MTRYHNIDGKRVAFTREEEQARDSEEARDLYDFAAARARAYPDVTEYLDAKVKQASPDPNVVAEGIAQEEAYLSACLEVKSSNPKPEDA